jgi:hypothetical protein
MRTDDLGRVGCFSLRDLGKGLSCATASTLQFGVSARQLSCCAVDVSIRSPGLRLFDSQAHPHGSHLHMSNCPCHGLYSIASTPAAFGYPMPTYGADKVPLASCPASTPRRDRAPIALVGLRSGHRQDSATRAHRAVPVSRTGRKRASGWSMSGAALGVEVGEAVFYYCSTP